MRKKRNSRSPKQQLTLAERTKQELQLLLAGASYREIAEAVGVAPSTVHDDVQRALRDIPRREADELRQVEVERLDRLQRAVWADAVKGDLPSVDRAVRIIDRRAKMLGLDAPQQVEVSGQDVDLDATVAKILAAARLVHEEGEGGAAGGAGD